MEGKIALMAFALTESFISRILKRFLYRKRKLHAINTINCDLTKEIMTKLAHNKNIKVVNLDTDYKSIIDPAENERLEILKNGNIETYKLILFPIIQKFVNMIFKYYARKYHIIIYSDNIELLSFVFGDKKIFYMVPEKEMFETLKNKTELQPKLTDLYKSTKDIYEYDTTVTAVEKVKEIFKIEK